MDQNLSMKKISVLMGGMSSEHVVSMNTGEQMVLSLQDKHIVQKIVWEMDGTVRAQEADGYYSKHSNIIEALGKIVPEFILLALHGQNGEDGKIQGLLDLMKIPYSGTGIKGSVIGMDKALSKTLLKDLGVRTPSGILIDNTLFSQGIQPIIDITKAHCGFPCFIKPNEAGSSIGSSKVMNPASFEPALSCAFDYGSCVLIEELVEGVEISIGVIERNKELTVLPIAEIIPSATFFDYECKYVSGKANEIIPARISNEIRKKLETIALTSFRKLQCRGYARFDAIIRNNEVFVLEVNTLPGMTTTSLVPQMAYVAGIDFSELLEIIIADGLNMFNNC